MAKDEHETRVAATPILMVNTEQYGAQELHRQQEELRKQGIKLNETVRGGKFLDGPNATTYHDAHGNSVGGDGSVLAPPPAAAAAVDAIGSDAELDALEEKIAARRETLKAEADARAEADKAKAKADAVADKEREKALAQQEKDRAAATKAAGGRR